MCNLQENTFEVFTRKYSVLLMWKGYVVFTTNTVLRLYEELCFSLFYDELARKYVLRRTNNDETCFLVKHVLRRTYYEFRRR